MTKSIFEKINLNSTHDDIVEYATSTEYLEKIKLCESKRHLRTPTITKKKTSLKMRTILSAIVA